MADDENVNVNEDEEPENPNSGNDEEIHGRTIDDPYMFTSFWTLVELADNDQDIHFFKFDRFNAPPIENIFIDEQITGTQIKYVDWNGAYIRNIYLRIPYNENTRDKGASEAYFYDFHVAFAFKSYAGTSQHWRNLEVENFYVSDPRVALFRGEACFHNCYFNNVVVSSELSPTSDYWLNDKGENCCPFALMPKFSECMIFFHSKNVAPRVPMAMLWSSYMYVDYKWDLKEGSLNDNGVIPRSCDTRMGQPFIGFNSILDGIIDISGAKGEQRSATGNLKLVREYIAGTADGNPLTTQGVTGVCGSYGGATTHATLTITLKTKVSDTNKIAMSSYMWGNSKNGSGGSVEPTIYGVPDELVSLTNYGDGYTGTSTYTYVNCDDMTRYQLMNPDYLDDINYNYVRDDLVRFQKFYNEYMSDTTYSIYVAIFDPKVDPAWVKRKNPCVNNQFPFLPFDYYPQIAMPIYNGSVSQNEYVIVYDMYTSEYNFNNHGLAVLEPTSCRVIEELNGAFNVTLTHPKDESGKYQYLLEMNLLKVLGQIFVIQRVDEVTNGNSHYVSVYAEHVTYTLDDRWIFPPVTIAGYTGQTLIDSIMAQAYDHGGGWQVQYDFNITSDLEAEEDFEDWDNMQEGCTPYEMIIGSNGLAARLGGELYRDNFNVSINKRMQNALENAFELRVGHNLTGIKRTVDLTTFCTYLRCFPVVDGELTGEWWAVAWDPRTLPRAYPREVVRSLNFHYTSEEAEQEGWWGKFTRDGQVAFGQMCQPQVSYELNVKDLKKNPDYQGFENGYRFKVGDMGKVWDERLQAWVDVEISRTEKNGITGETEKVIIGNTRRFTRPSGYNPIVPSNYKLSAEKTIEGAPPLAFTSDGSFLSNWTINGAAGGVGEETTVNVFDFDSWLAALMENKYTVSGTEYTAAYGLTIAPYTNQTTGVKGITFTTTQSYGYTFSWTVYGLIPIYLEHGRQYTLSWVQSKNAGYAYFNIRLHKGNSALVWMQKTSNSQRSMTFTMPDDCDYLCLSFKTDDMSKNWSIIISNIQITTTTYEIPVRIRQDAQHEQTVRIPIDAPLGVNNYINYNTKPIGIPTYYGDNTLYVDTTVQPSRVSITYKEAMDDEGNQPVTLDDTLPLTFNSNGSELMNWRIYGAVGGVGDYNDVFNLSSWLTGVQANTQEVSGTTYTGFVGGTITPVTNGFTIYCDGSQQYISYTLSAAYPSSGYSVAIGPVPRNVPCTLKWTQDDTIENMYVRVYPSGSSSYLATTSVWSQRVLTFTSPANTYDYLDILILFDGSAERTVTFTDMVLIAGDLEIPVTITGEHDSATVQIPISVPLDENSSVGFQDTRIPIPTFIGENTITVGTTVQPSHMLITYREPQEEEEE